MFDYIAYLTAQQRTADRAQGALPDSPIRESESAIDPVRPGHLFRHGISNGLRRLADRLEPMRECPPHQPGAVQAPHIADRRQPDVFG